ncbi:MAG: metal ABC transporter permease [Terriglobia bacterium]|nr:metal ABC transporter permease [Terriglobia bacterium]
MLRVQPLLLILAMCFSIAAAVVGCVALMKRMLLASDVMSHLALPGIGLALLLKESPISGGAATLFLGTFLVWRLEKKTGLATDSAVGVIFATALAIGAAIIPNEDLAESLFGNLGRISVVEFVLGMAAVSFVVFSIFLLRDQLSLSILSPDLATATGVKVSRLDLRFLLLFSLTVLVGLRFMGALLAASLIIMPAATARQLADKLASFILLAIAISLLSVTGGFLLNTFVFKISTVGPVITIFSALLFSASLLVRSKRSLG